MDDTSDQDEVARRFRENDTLGDPSSFWYRATRPFFEEQKPIGKMVLLSTGPTQDKQLPLGLFTYTDNNRMIFWPALAKGKKPVVIDDKILDMFDHITIEFPSEKMHLTYYNDIGTKKHIGNAARTFHYEGYDLAICFQILVKLETLRDQDSEIQRNLQMSPDQQARMGEWLQDYASNLKIGYTLCPPNYENCDYIQYAILLDPNSLTEDQIPPVDNILVSDGRKQFADDWDTGEKYPVHFSRFRVGDHKLLIAVACPPGKLRHSTAFLLARRRMKKKPGLVS